MKNQELSRQVQRIRALLARVEAATSGDLELQAHWAKYLCVLTSGLLENAVSELYGDYVKRTSSPSVAAFATSTLEGILNPKSKKFLEIAGKFTPKWKDELDAFLSDDGRRDAIDSLIANRHLIAHGSLSGMTMARFKEYFERALAVLEFIEAQCS